MNWIYVAIVLTAFGASSLKAPEVEVETKTVPVLKTVPGWNEVGTEKHPVWDV